MSVGMWKSWPSSREVSLSQDPSIQPSAAQENTLAAQKQDTDQVNTSQYV